MANDRNRSDDQLSGPSSEGEREYSNDPVRGGMEDDVRGVADEADEEFEETEDLEADEDSDESF